MHIEEIQIDVPFFEENKTAANALIELTEIVGCWFTMLREENAESESVPSESVNSLYSTGGNTYCYCNGVDDSSKMICCGNDDCPSGQWFHFKCVNIRRTPRRKWFCRECLPNNS